MEQLKFGDILRTTRERKGLDFNETAQRLRIRPDILRAIEESNVSAMPPRGYARNMVTGYARYLGLDPNEMSRLYIEELQIYEDRRARVRARVNGESVDSTDRNTRVSSRTVSRPDESRMSQRGSTGSTGRIESDDAHTERMDRVDSQGQSRRSRSSQDASRSNPLQAAAGTLHNAASNIASKHRPSFNASGRGRQSRDPMLKANDYVTFYQDRGGGIESKLPFILAAAIILLVLIILGALLFGGHGKKNDVATMPVTSVEESVQQQQEAIEQAPTKFTFAYKIDEGTEAWTEIYLDGENQLAEIVTGPAEGSYDVTGTVQFICAASDGVHITIDGEEQELEYDGSGMVNVTYDFADYLKKWQEAHGLSGSGTTSNSNSNASSSSDSESTQDTESQSEDTTTTEEQVTEEQPAEETYYDDTVYYDDGTYTEEVYY